MKKEDIKGIELRHVVYCTDKGKNNDLLVLNEYVHTKDGQRVKNMRFLENYERPFWIVNEAERTYEDNKQWISEDRLTQYSSTQCRLFRSINQILKTNYYSNKNAFTDPYVFGCGPTLQSEIKHQYKKRWEEFITPQSGVAVLDTETDVIHGHEQVILCTITYEHRAFVGVTRQFLKNTPEEVALPQIERTLQTYLGDVLKERGIDKVEVGMFDSAGEAVHACIKKAHLWQPDFLEFWNMNFDMKKMIKALESDGLNLAAVFSDPRVPEKYRWFKYVEGDDVKTIHTGNTMPISPAEQWHVANAPASFFMVCGMTSYYRFRIAKGKVSGGYGLDATLERHGKRGKLKFDKVKSKKLRWHQEMQTKYPYEYIAYNLMDCIAVEMLDEEIQDMNMKFNTRCTVADYTEFKSGPRVAEVKMNYSVVSAGCRLGVCGGSLKNEHDKLTVEYKGWPLTLPASLIEDSPVHIMSDWSSLSSLVYYNVSDLDISSTYPAVQVMLNIAKSTTTREVIAIQKRTKYQRNRVFMDTVTGVSSALAVANIGFGLPDLMSLGQEFDAYLSGDEEAA